MECYDVLNLIFQYLELDTLHICAHVCKAWREVAYSPALWRKFVFINTPQLRLLDISLDAVESLQHRNIKVLELDCKGTIDIPERMNNVLKCLQLDALICRPYGLGALIALPEVLFSQNLKHLAFIDDGWEKVGQIKAETLRAILLPMVNLEQLILYKFRQSQRWYWYGRCQHGGDKTLPADFLPIVLDSLPKLRDLQLYNFNILVKSCQKEKVYDNLQSLTYTCAHKSMNLSEEVSHIATKFPSLLHLCIGVPATLHRRITPGAQQPHNDNSDDADKFVDDDDDDDDDDDRRHRLRCPNQRRLYNNHIRSLDQRPKHFLKLKSLKVLAWECNGIGLIDQLSIQRLKASAPELKVLDIEMSRLRKPLHFLNSLRMLKQLTVLNLSSYEYTLSPEDFLGLNRIVAHMGQLEVLIVPPITLPHTDGSLLSFVDLINNNLTKLISLIGIESLESCRSLCSNNTIQYIRSSGVILRRLLNAGENYVCQWRQVQKGSHDWYKAYGLKYYNLPGFLYCENCDDAMRQTPNLLLSRPQNTSN